MKFQLPKGSVYFTENSGYRSLKNRSCVTVFGSCSVTLTVGEPLGDVSGSANHDFRTSVTGISGEIDASLPKLCRSMEITKLSQKEEAKKQNTNLQLVIS